MQDHHHVIEWAYSVEHLAHGWRCVSPICSHFELAVRDEDLWAHRN